MITQIKKRGRRLKKSINSICACLCVFARRQVIFLNLCNQVSARFLEQTLFNLKPLFETTLNFWFFLSFALGITAGFHFSSFILFSLCACLAICLICFFYKKKKLFISDIFILSLFIFLGALWQISYTYQDIDKFLHKENKFVLKVTSLPMKHYLKNTFMGELKEINGIPVDLKVKVIDWTNTMSFRRSYKAEGKLSKKRYGRNTSYYLWIKSKANLDNLPLGIGDKWTQKTTDYILTLFRNNANEESSRLLASIFLGRRELLKEGTSDFNNAGATHLLAISGSNVAIIALILFSILKMFNIRFRMSLSISLIILFFYAVLTGMSPSIVRAVIMYSAFAAAFFFKRKINPFNSLGLAGIISLLINPLSLFDIGFQLSYLSVLALIVGFKIFPYKRSPHLFLSYIKQIIFSSLWVILCINPILSYYFGRLQLLNTLYNIILIPIFTLILGLNFLFLVLSPLGRFVTYSLGSVFDFLIAIFLKCVHYLGSIKFSFLLYTFSLKGIIIYYIFLIIVCLFLYKRRLVLANSSQTN